MKLKPLICDLSSSLRSLTRQCMFSSTEVEPTP